MNKSTVKSEIAALWEKGLGYVTEGNPAEANQCFEEIIKAHGAAQDEADKALIAGAHNQLGIAAKAGWLFSNAIRHFDAARAVIGFKLDLEMNRGTVLISLGRLDEAEGVFNGILGKNPGNPGALFQMGRLAQKQGAYEKSLPLLEQAVKAMPNDVNSLLELGIAQEKCGKDTEGARSFQTVRTIAPDLYEKLYNRAGDLKSNHHFPEALEALVRASKILPDNPIAHHMVAILFQDLEKKDLAEAFLKKSIALHPTPESFSQLAALYEKSNALNDAWATANTGLQLFPDDPYLHLTMARCERRAKKFDQALNRLKGLEGKIDDQVVNTQVQFLMGWLYDQQDELENAFGCYSMAKETAAKTLNEGTEDKTSFLQYIQNVKRLDLSRLSKPAPEKRPQGPREVAFLVGFPRSGTTLLNQILDSHPRLVGMEEKPTIPGPAALLQQMEADYPLALEGIDEAMAGQLRDAYNQRIDSFADYTPDSVLIDKLPLNLTHLPLIWTMFPDAKIILALRHPLGCSLSCFMHNFRLNDAMANMFSLDDITALYVKIMDLWQHFRAEKDFPVHVIKYEDVVTDLQKEAEKLCTFLDVEWSEEMLNYAKHARAKGLINTPSYHQVIQPLYSDSLERWQRYEKYLEPYKERLAPFCKAFGYPL